MWPKKNFLCTTRELWVLDPRNLRMGGGGSQVDYYYYPFHPFSFLWVFVKLKHQSLDVFYFFLFKKNYFISFTNFQFFFSFFLFSFWVTANLFVGSSSNIFYGICFCFFFPFSRKKEEKKRCGISIVCSSSPRKN